MDVRADVVAPVEEAVLFAWVDDLTHYPQWLEIVARAEPAPAAAGDPGPAWLVDLRGRLGPLARSKRLRMVRTHHDAPHLAVFERRELDGRAHAPWALRAEIRPAGETSAVPEAGVVGEARGSSRLAMHLHYGGSLWGPVLERLLADEIDRAPGRLVALVSAGGG